MSTELTADEREAIRGLLNSPALQKLEALRGSARVTGTAEEYALASADRAGFERCIEQMRKLLDPKTRPTSEREFVAFEPR